jgi:probable rRNA maturation factor
VAIEVVNRQRLIPLERGLTAELASAVLAAIRFERAAVTIAFVRDPAIRRLNRNFRGVDFNTDVLSFPAEAGPRPATESYLGDVVVSADAAKRQAARAGIPLDREIAELVIHGILHLCGYDHEADNGEMNRLELKLRKELLDRGKSGRQVRVEKC